MSRSSLLDAPAKDILNRVEALYGRPPTAKIASVASALIRAQVLLGLSTEVSEESFMANLTEELRRIDRAVERVQTTRRHAPQEGWVDEISKTLRQQN